MSDRGPSEVGRELPKKLLRAVDYAMDALEADATDRKRRAAWYRLRAAFYPVPKEVRDVAGD